MKTSSPRVGVARMDRQLVAALQTVRLDDLADTIRNDPRVQEVYFGTGKTFQPRAPLHEAAW